MAELKGLRKEGTRPWAWEKAIPARFRDLFGGMQKHYVSLKTHDYDEAVRRGILAKREFEEKCGTGSSPIQVDIATVAGIVFEDVMHRPEGMTPREAIVRGVARHKRADHPLVQSFPDEGPTFDRMADIVEKMWKASAMSLPELRHRVTQKSLTLEEQAVEWVKTKPPLTAKTIDQYIHDVGMFSRWYEGSRNELALGAAINRRDANDFVLHRMKANESKSTIMRRLAGLMVYKSGQFSDDNPFANVTSRIDIHGPRRVIRDFSDPEVRLLFKESKECDINVQWVTRLALYTGMRLNEMCTLRTDDLVSVQIGKEKVWYL
ncbi:MAG: hypothetical protein PS018_23135, partial [bacterium]|nr:hypothetical protein [bacterium]